MGKLLANTWFRLWFKLAGFFLLVYYALRSNEFADCYQNSALTLLAISVVGLIVCVVRIACARDAGAAKKAAKATAGISRDDFSVSLYLLGFFVLYSVLTSTDGGFSWFGISMIALMAVATLISLLRKG